MTPLVVEVDGRVLRLDGKSRFLIGRAIEADVLLTATSVSRRHAELRADERGWLLVDAGSQFGTFVDGRRIGELRIEGRVVVRCGPPASGVELVITPADQVPADEADASAPVSPAPIAEPPGTTSTERPAPAPAPPAPEAPVPPGEDRTEVLAAYPGPRAAGPRGPAPDRTGPDLLLVAEGREYRFRHPAQISVGRRTDCTVVLTDPACSRQHGLVQGVPGAWTYTNVSGEGTFHEGRRVATLRFHERTVLRLGHPVAGPELTLVPILSAAEEEQRIARRRRLRRLAVVGVAAAVVVLLVGVVAGVAWWTGDRDQSVGRPVEPTPSGTGGSGGLARADLDAAKAATVKISAESYYLDDPGRSVITYGGSGSILRSDGLILTNAHVAAPEAPGIAEQYGQGEAIANPDYLLISLTDGLTDTSEPAAYRARVVEADGYLDAAIIEIYADAGGRPLTTEPDLPTVPIGSSAPLRAGDDVTVLGFPAVAGAGDSITVTTGVISTVLNDPQLGPRSELDTDARIAPGNSGGMAIDDDGELIGIPTSLYIDPSSPVASGRIRSIDAVKDLIADAEAKVG
ncbi:FHA domain-containing protein [Nocardioides sp. GY 10113]|uniref:FHA domain-containing protein n=1 Tax=Nocardioides sp. GY 10113 TaxID=2569761 RepID=UPI0010A82F41|nr:FHA domain-containing protein [Nocardioides sp. GY 10113]TIC87332.1 FHA domain-containing protein [Nocardioides sp. GY 10113]